MPFLPLNQQRQSSEGLSKVKKVKLITEKHQYWILCAVGVQDAAAAEERRLGDDSAAAAGDGGRRGGVALDQAASPRGRPGRRRRGGAGRDRRRRGGRARQRRRRRRRAGPTRRQEDGHVGPGVLLLPGDSGRRRVARFRAGSRGAGLFDR